MMEQLPLFSTVECEQIRDLIHELRPLWTPRPLQFEHDGKVYEEESYTLGAASYCDAWQSLEAYLRAAETGNAGLRRYFGWIYPRLAQVIQKATDRPVVYDEDLALPGFHIFLAAAVFELPVAPIHFDFHSRLLSWEGKDVSLRDTISYTASIALPKGGAGLNVWDLTSSEIEGMGYEQIRALAEQRRKRFVQYTVGNAFVHSGEIVHQIAPWQGVSTGDERITLQGQGIRAKDAYLLFW